MRPRVGIRSLCFAPLWLLLALRPCAADLRDDAHAGAQRAVTFLTDTVSTDGGYLWRYSADLKLREGEGVVDTQTIWIQPPGTPTVGNTFLRLYAATHDPQFLQAAQAVGGALRNGQMKSGGWQAMIEFEPARRTKWAYRTDSPRPKSKDQSSLDDDKTQAALRFVMRLDQALRFADPKIHEMAEYALDGLIEKGQYPNGGFPQVWTDAWPEGVDDTARAANYPESWEKTYPGHREYWYRYTLNDDLAPTVMRTLFLAYDIYHKDRYRHAALRLADFLMLAQMPAPQPAWAQQYSFAMQPIWARKFEPPAITGGESQGVIETLMMVYERTGDTKYLSGLGDAIDYLQTCETDDGKLARFYEMRTNRPLFFTREYELTYDDANIPTHYAFWVPSRVATLRTRYEQLVRNGVAAAGVAREKRRGNPSPARVRNVLKQLDERAWVTNTGLRYHRQPGPVIDMGTTVENLNVLADFLRP